MLVRLCRLFSSNLITCGEFEEEFLILRFCQPVYVCFAVDLPVRKARGQRASGLFFLSSDALLPACLRWSTGVWEDVAVAGRKAKILQPVLSVTSQEKSHRKPIAGPRSLCHRHFSLFRSLCPRRCESTEPPATSVPLPPARDTYRTSRPTRRHTDDPSNKPKALNSGRLIFLVFACPVGFDCVSCDARNRALVETRIPALPP